MSASARPKARAAWLAGIVLLAALVRCAYVAAAGTEQDMPGLAHKYGWIAGKLANGEGFWLGGNPPVPYVDRIPGYVVLRAGLHAVAGTEPLPLAMAHGALAALAAGCATLAAWTLLGHRAGIISGLGVALLPPLWRSDTQLIETGACGVAITASLLALALHVKAPSWPRAIGLALATTFAVSLRPDALLVPALAVVVGAALQPSRRMLLVPSLLLPLVIAVPWALRNGRVADGRFVSVGVGAVLLGAVGESVATDEPTFGDREVAASEGHRSLFWPDPQARDRARVRRALGLIAERPGSYAVGCLRRVAVCLTLHGGELWPGGPTAKDSIRAWREANPGRGRYAGLVAATLHYLREAPLRALLTLAWGPLVVGLAGWGAWSLRRERRLLALLLAFPLYGLLTHVPLHAEPRYFLPFAPALIVLAAATWRDRGDRAMAP